MYGTNLYGYPSANYGSRSNLYNQSSPFNVPQYPQYQTPSYAGQTTGQQAPAQQLFKVQAVTNIEEARAAIVEPDVISIFTDFANGKIYTKQLNMADGTSIFRAYETERPAVAPSQPAVEYATLSDVEALKGEIEAIKKLITAPAAKAKTEAKEAK